MLFCDACDKGYHMTCHTPKLDQMPSGQYTKQQFHLHITKQNKSFCVLFFSGKWYSNLPEDLLKVFFHVI